MTKKKLIMIHCVLVGIVVILVVVGIVCFNVFKIPSAQEVFKRNIESIVELKAYNETDSKESFGSAQIIDENGTIVTNAHIVTYKAMQTIFCFEKMAIRFASETEYLQAELKSFDVEH